MMVLGYLLRRTGRIAEEFADKLNTFVFKIALPVQLFEDVVTSNFQELWDGGVVLFCLTATIISILVMLGLSMLGKKSLRAEFTQAGYRSSQALLGTALMQNIYGQNGPLALILIGSVPLYNVAAVLLLTLMAPGGGHLDRKTMKKTLRGIAGNPIILGILAGVVWSLLGIPLPAMAERTVSNLAATATPLGLIALGASIDLTAYRCGNPRRYAVPSNWSFLWHCFCPWRSIWGTGRSCWWRSW